MKKLIIIIAVALGMTACKKEVVAPKTTDVYFYFKKSFSDKYTRSDSFDFYIENSKVGSLASDLYVLQDFSCGEKFLNFIKTTADCGQSYRVVHSQTNSNLLVGKVECSGSCFKVQIK